MQEIRALTGLRGIAALIVFFAHTREHLTDQGIDFSIPILVQRLFLMGGRQVDIFFVLSGFILALTYQKWFVEAVTSATYWKFLQRRIARIYPLHFVVLLLVLAMVTAARVLHLSTTYGLDRFDLTTLPAHLLLVHAWGFLDGAGEWNPPSWSISIEAVAYLIFPFLIWGTVRWAREKPWVLVGIAVAIGLALNAATHWSTYGFGGLARGLSEFLLGCATVNLYQRPIAQWLQSNLGAWLAVLFLAVVFALTPDTGFVIGIATAPLLLTLSADNAVSRMVGSRPLFFLGEISYSIYLGHFLFSSAAYRVVSVQWMKTGTLQVVVGVTVVTAIVVVASTVTYYAIERPGRDWLSGRRAKKAASAVVSTGGA